MNWNMCNKYRIFEKTKIYFKRKTLSFFIVYSKYGNEYEKIFKEEESIEKILCLINNVVQYQKIDNV